MNEVIIASIAVVSKAFSKIALALMGTTLFLLTVKQARDVKVYVAAIISAIAIGIIMNLFGIAHSWTSAATHTFALIGGFFSFTVLHIFGKLHGLVSEDDELVQAMYQKLREKVLKKGGK